MGLKGFGLFMKLRKSGHDLTAMGLNGTTGDVQRLSKRLLISKSFRGLNLEGITPRTTRGYDALILAFLTHSALELYLQIMGQNLSEIEVAHKDRGSDLLIAEVFDSDDRHGHLFNFLYARLNKHLKIKLVIPDRTQAASVAGC